MKSRYTGQQFLVSAIRTETLWAAYQAMPQGTSCENLAAAKNKWQLAVQAEAAERALLANEIATTPSVVRPWHLPLDVGGCIVCGNAPCPYGIVT